MKNNKIRNREQTTQERSLLIVDHTERLGDALCLELCESFTHVVGIRKHDSPYQKKTLKQLAATDLHFEQLLQPPARQMNREGEEWVKEKTKRFSGLDAFLFILPDSSIDNAQSITVTEWQESMDLLRRMFWYYRAVAKIMANQSFGSIIGVCNGVCARGDEQLLSMTVMGEALIGMSKCLAQELLPKNVRINVLCTGLMEEADYPFLMKKKLSKLTKMFGMQRYGKSSDISAMVTHLCSEHGSYMTGQAIHVNGGLII